MTEDDEIIAIAREAAAKHGHTLKVEPSPETREFIVELFNMAAAKERQRILRETPGDWGAAYDAFRAGDALPNDAPALQYAFAAGMAHEREACKTACDTTYYQFIGPEFGEVRYGISACKTALDARSK